jgi:hypothetical protein
MANGRWELASDLLFNRAVNQYADGNGRLGLFTGDGWCLIGICVRPFNTSRYHAEFGVILLNVFGGIWWNADPSGDWGEQWKSNLGCVIQIVALLAVIVAAVLVAVLR